MNNPKNHLSSEQIQVYVDGGMSDLERSSVESHLASCSACRISLISMRRIDAALRSLEIERTRPEFTSAVMNKLGVVPKSPLIFRAVEKFAYFFGLLIVLGIMLAAFLVTGIVEMRQIQQTESVASGVYSQLTGNVMSAFNAVSQWLVEYLPFVFGKGSLNIVLFVVAVLFALAVADRLIGNKMLGRAK